MKLDLFIPKLYIWANIIFSNRDAQIFRELAKANALSRVSGEKNTNRRNVSFFFFLAYRH